METDPNDPAQRQDATAQRGGAGAAFAIDEELANREFDDVAVSWHRCAEIHHVNPANRRAPEVVTAGELRQSREPIEGLVRAAQSELDQLYRVVRRAGYVVLLSDTNGVAVEYRGNDARSAQFRYWGIWLGGVWSEASEGTNGTLLSELGRRFVVQPPRGGLSASALRRVCEFVESHLEDNIGLDALAAQAHLSVYHFARAFGHRAGVSPHRYVLEQRVRRAQQLLVQTDLPLANIASAVGFSDQGHFSRQFRGLVGTTPSTYRKMTDEGVPVSVSVATLWPPR